MDIYDNSYTTGIGLRTAKLGIRLLRPTAQVPATFAPIFNIVGGKVLMTLLIGHITTVLATVGNISFEENPTNGTMETISGVTAVGTYAQDNLIGITGVPAGTPVPAAGGGIPGMTTQGVVLRIGTLEQRLSLSDTGQIEYTVFYIPLEVGSYMSIA